MRLPFTQQQFLDVFGAYNAALWPALAVLWVATVWVTIQLVRGRPSSLALSTVAAAHWAWSGIVYHAWYFSRINPAAWLFAALFIMQAAGFVWSGVVHRRLMFDWSRSPRHIVAGVFVAYSFLYPVLVVLSHHTLPRAPVAGVPCPTTLFTSGLLFAAKPRVPRLLLMIPIAWSVIGGSAALVLGMTPDLMLLVGAALLVVYAARRGILPDKTGRPRPPRQNKPVH
jgi:hypothetical protein